MKWFAEKQILVPFDFSDESKAAVDVALQLAESPGNVHVFHVLPHLVATEPGVIWSTVDDEHRTRHALEGMEKALDAPHTKGVHLDVGIGDPGHVITEAAQQIPVGLIVISSHGRTGISRLMLGSVAERVVRLAHCPVLVLRE